MKVNDYVRTENGIDKIIGYRYEPEYENGHVLWFEKSDSGCRFTDKDLPKSSPKIIDLVQIGDYVNGYYVEEIRRRYDGEMITILDVATGSNYFQAPMYNDEIKSIVTKEQFEKMEYKVGE